MKKFQLNERVIVTNLDEKKKEVILPLEDRNVNWEGDGDLYRSNANAEKE